MRTCEEYTELMSARLDGGLTAEQEAELEEHLRNCPDCAALWADLAALHAELPGLWEEPPADLIEKTMERIRAEADGAIPFPAKQRAPVHRWRKWGAMAAVMAVAFLGAFHLYTQGFMAATGGSSAPGMDRAGMESSAGAAAPAEEPSAAASCTPELAAPSAAPAPEPSAPAIPMNTAAPEQGQAGAQGSDGGRDQAVPRDAPAEGAGDMGGASPRSAVTTAEPGEGGASDMQENAAPSQSPTTLMIAPMSRELTQEEALRLLYEEKLAADWPDAEYTLAEDFEGYTLAPLTEAGEGTARGEYLAARGLSGNGAYYLFERYTETVELPGGTVENAVLNHYAVPLTGDGILTEREAPADDLGADAFWAAVGG